MEPIAYPGGRRAIAPPPLAQRKQRKNAFLAHLRGLFAATQVSNNFKAILQALEGGKIY